MSLSKLRMKKIMTFIFCIMMSLSFGYASVNARPSCTIGAENCIVGDGDGSNLIEIPSRKDPSGQKSVFTYSGPYEISLYDTAFEPNFNERFISTRDYVFFPKNLMSKKSDFCSIYGDDWFEVDRDYKGDYLQQSNTYSTSSTDVIDLNNDIFYEYYSNDLHNGYEIHSYCNQVDIVQAYDTYSADYIYLMEKSYPNYDLKMAYIPMASLYEHIGDLYPLLNEAQKNQVLNIVALLGDIVSLGTIGAKIAALAGDEAVVLTVEAALKATAPELVIAAILTMLIIEDGYTDIVVDAALTELYKIGEIESVYDQNTVFQLSSSKIISTNGMKLEKFHQDIKFNKTKITKVDDSFYADNEYWEITKIDVSYENIVNIFIEMYPSSFLDELFGAVFG